MKLKVILASIVMLLVISIASYPHLRAYQLDLISQSLNDWFVDDFDNDGSLQGYTTNNAIALPDVGKKDGRYHAILRDNTNDKTLHYKKNQGRLDGVPIKFPFEVIVRNIGIGTIEESQQAPKPVKGNYIFAGVQIHAEDLQRRISSHVVVGHRGNQIFTVEGKNTVDGESFVTDEGSSVAPQGRADIRILGLPERTLRVMWQTPRIESESDDWILYNGHGKLPGTEPTYDEYVIVGLITYAQGKAGVPFVGTAESFLVRGK